MMTFKHNTHFAPPCVTKTTYNYLYTDIFLFAYIRFPVILYVRTDMPLIQVINCVASKGNNFYVN